MTHSFSRRAAVEEGTYFVHISAVQRAGPTTLNEGQQIEHEPQDNRGKTAAVDLEVR
jgi:CspA family cold shock protein